MLSKKIALSILTGILSVYLNDQKTFADIPAVPESNQSVSTNDDNSFSVTTTQTFDDGSTLSVTETYGSINDYFSGTAPESEYTSSTDATDTAGDPSEC